MRVLAIDTALGATSVAILDLSGACEPVLEREEMQRGHAEALMPMVARVLEKSGVEFSAIDRFAVTIGPGSFTGLRIGISAARGFALVHGKPAVGVSTLAAFAAPHVFAQGEAERRPVAAAVNARNGTVFFQALGIDGRTIAGPGLYTLEDAARKTGDGQILCVGDGAEMLALAKRDIAPDYRLTAASIRQMVAPDIFWVARLGAAADPKTAPARPLYLREANVTVQDRHRLPRA